MKKDKKSKKDATTECVEKVDFSVLRDRILSNFKTSTNNLLVAVKKSKKKEKRKKAKKKLIRILLS